MSSTLSHRRGLVALSAVLALFASWLMVAPPAAALPETEFAGSGQIPRWFTATPDPVAFGRVPVTDGYPKLVTIENVGSEQLEFPLDATRLAGPDARWFSFLQDTCSGATVDPGQTCVLELVFGPRTPGAKSATITLAESSGDPMPLVPLTGTGVGGQASVAPAPLKFGHQRVGTASDVGTQTLTNTGNAALHVGTATLAGPDASQFAIVGQSSCAGKTVAPGSSCALRFRFRPTTAGAKSAWVQYSHDGSGASTSNLTGTGTPAATPVPPSAVTYTPGKRSIVRWAGTPEATGYQVMVNGRLACSTTAASSFCKVRGKLGPKANVKVRSTGADGVHSKWVIAQYRANPVAVLLATVHFPPFSAQLSAKSKSRLRSVATLLEVQGFRSVVLTGFTARIPDASNPSLRQRLSKQRAVAVKRFLQQRLETADVQVRMRVKAKGGRDPVASNDTESGRAKNRRAEVALG